MPDTDLGALAAALAKAQAAFPAVTRDKEVTVTSDKGSYKFKYAPLDKIIEAIRGPLSANGLAFTQLLDSDPDGLPFLTTRLLHESGASIEGRTPIPFPEGAKVQAFGSAITYIRRYALQALLGIAAEEDDDGNAAQGNRASFRDKGDPPPPSEPRDGSLIGTVEAAKPPHDLELRQTPTGPVIGFGLKEGRQIVRVLAHGELAEHIAAFIEAVQGKRVTAFGTMTDESWTLGAGTAKERRIPYIALTASRITGPDGLDLPMHDGQTPEAAGPSVERVDPPTTQPEAPQTPASGLCGNRGSLDTVCNLPKDHPGKHRELATDGRVLASW